METATFSLLVGCLGAGLDPGGSRRALYGAGRPRPGPPPGGAQPAGDAPWDHSGEVYRKLLGIRLASVVLCVLAAAVLFLQHGTGPALALAGLGCCLHYAAYRIRTRHVQAVQKAALLTPKDAPAEAFRDDDVRTDNGSSVRPARTA